MFFEVSGLTYHSPITIARLYLEPVTLFPRERFSSSHQPIHVEEAARAGSRPNAGGPHARWTDLAVRHLVATQTPYLAGRYDVAGMPLIVCRGTGTFGPRMRLWYPSEIVAVTVVPRTLARATATPAGV